VLLRTENLKLKTSPFRTPHSALPYFPTIAAATISAIN
jgi:hypothetical protein